MLPQTDTALNVNRFGKSVCGLDTSPLRTDRRASGNSGFKKLAVQWLNQVQFFNQTFVQVDSFVLRNRQLLKPANRYVSALEKQNKTTIFTLRKQ